MPQQPSPVRADTGTRLAVVDLVDPAFCATVDDVAAMPLFLASSDADYCTGQAPNVAGGMIMH